MGEKQRSIRYYKIGIFSTVLFVLMGCLTKDKGTSSEAENQDELKAIPIVKGLSQEYDTLTGTAKVTWSPVKYSKFAEYLVYRSISGKQVSIFNPTETKQDTVFQDTLFRKTTYNGKLIWADTQSVDYVYTIRVRNLFGEIGPPSETIQVKAVSPIIFEFLNLRKIPVVDLNGAYDTAYGTYILKWRKPSYPELAEYLIFRNLAGDSLSTIPYERTQDTIFSDWIFRPEIQNGKSVFSDTNPKNYVYRVAVRNTSNETGFKSAQLLAKCVSPLLAQTQVKISVLHEKQDQGAIGYTSSIHTLTPNDTIVFIAKYHNESKKAVEAKWSIRWRDGWDGHYGEEPFENHSLFAKTGIDTLFMTWTTTFPERSTGNLILRIKDEDGRLWSDSVFIQLYLGVPKISSMATPRTHSGDPLRLYATGRIDDFLGKIVKYEWDIGGKGNFIPVTGGDTIIQAPSTPGNFDCILRVTDDDGLHGIWGSTFLINNWVLKETISGVPAFSPSIQGRYFFLPNYNVASGNVTLLEYNSETRNQNIYNEIKGYGNFRLNGSLLYYINTNSNIQELDPKIGSWSNRGNLKKWVDSSDYNNFISLSANVGKLNQDLFMYIDSELVYHPKMRCLVMKFNSTTTEWERREPFPFYPGPKSENTIFSGGKLYAIGEAIYSYDPDINAWEKRAELPLPYADYQPVSVMEHAGRISFGLERRSNNFAHDIQHVVDFTPQSNHVSLRVGPPEGLTGYVWAGERLFAVTAKRVVIANSPVVINSINIAEYDGTVNWAQKFPVSNIAHEVDVSKKFTSVGFTNGSLFIMITTTELANRGGLIPTTKVYEYPLYD